MSKHTIVMHAQQLSEWYPFVRSGVRAIGWNWRTGGHWFSQSLQFWDARNHHLEGSSIYKILGLPDSQPPFLLSKYPFNSLIISVLSILMKVTEHLNSHINRKNVQRVFSNGLLSYAQKESKQEQTHIPSAQCSSQHHNLLLK